MSEQRTMKLTEKKMLGGQLDPLTR